MFWRSGNLNKLRVFTKRFQSNIGGPNKHKSEHHEEYRVTPFKIHGRKIIPFPVLYWGTIIFFFSFPFLTTFMHLKRSGNL